MRRFLLALALLLATVPVGAQTNTEPFDITLRTEKGSALTHTELDDALRALRNFFTQVEADYHLFIAGGTGLPATCDPLQVWVRTDATSGKRIYICESTDTWVLQGDGTTGDVETLSTSGGSGTAPVSDGLGALTMTDVATEAELTTHTGNASAHHAKTIDASELTTGTIPAARVGADHIDALTEIAAGLKSGADATLITGTAGTSGNCVEWNVDGDVVDSGGACGGGGAVGGADTEMLFNNSGTEDGLSWLTVDDTNQLLTQSSTLDQATGNEAAFTLGYTVNKATSGNDTGLVINQTDTASPGTSLFAEFQVGGVSKLTINPSGGISHAGSGATTAAHAQSLNLNWSTTATNQTSSGINSAVIGKQNRATADSAIAFGGGNVATGSSGVALGNANTNNGIFSVALGDRNTVDSGSNSAVVMGALSQSAVEGDISLVAGHQGYSNNRSQFVMGGGNFAAVGDAQSATITLKAATTDATQTTMQAGGTNYVIRADFAWAFSALVSARSDEADGNDSAAYRIEGLIARDESNNTAIVGSVTVTTIAESAGAASWDVTVEADDANEALAIKVTGDAATNIRWVAKVDVAQVGHP